MRWSTFFLLAVALHSQAEDSQLVELRNTLSPLIAHRRASPDIRDATDALTLVKHQLRDWVETQLPRLKAGDDRYLFANELNGALRKAGLFDITGDDVGVGVLGEIQLTNAGPFLVLRTSVGIMCGYDDSAYLYEWKQGAWQRRWENEQNIYTKQAYHPQTITSILASPYSADGKYLLLTIGNMPWCSSNWRPVYFRLWRISSSASPMLLWDESDEWPFSPDEAVGRVGRDSILIEYNAGSIAPDIHSYPSLLHYRIHGDQLERIDPVALGPRDFVEEWLKHPWSQAKLWSASPDLLAKHKVASGAVLEFDLPSHHCLTPDLWQVSGKRGDKPVSYLVRWRPPFHFTMVDIRDRPWPACTEEDTAADERRTLFSGQR